MIVGVPNILVQLVSVLRGLFVVHIKRVFGFCLSPVYVQVMKPLAGVFVFVLIKL